jgi:steroid 5-alpha reductase family enzyme
VTPAWLFGSAAALLFVVFSVLFVVERVRRDASHVDVAWAAAIGALALYYAWASPGDATRRAMIAGAAALWAFRLAGYLLKNRVIGKTEDGRYRALRQKWGPDDALQFFVVFQLQAALALLFSVPIWVAVANPGQGIRAFELCAAGITLVSVLGESVADAQLAAHRSRPDTAGKTCRTGLWRYSRHPNYFFEWLGWWAWVLCAVGSPYFALSLLGPGLMLLFLFKVTGIPATEAQALRSRGADYAEYQRTTSVFVPWFVRDPDQHTAEVQR